MIRLTVLLATDNGAWVDPFPVLQQIVFAAAIGLVPLLAIVAFVRLALGRDSDADE